MRTVCAYTARRSSCALPVRPLQGSWVWFETRRRYIWPVPHRIRPPPLIRLAITRADGKGRGDLLSAGLYSIIVGSNGENDGRASFVQLENELDLSIRSYITGADGRYHFSEVSYDIDYALRARCRKNWSKSSTSNRRAVARRFVEFGMATIPDLLDGHVTLEVECLDRLYLNGYTGTLVGLRFSKSALTRRH